jgi:hypothetical protein
MCARGGGGRLLLPLPNPISLLITSTCRNPGKTTLRSSPSFFRDTHVMHCEVMSFGTKMKNAHASNTALFSSDEDDRIVSGGELFAAQKQMVVKRRQSAEESQQSADQRKLWSGDSREQSSEDVQTGENRISADLPLQLEENTPLVHPAAGSLRLANQRPASQRELLTDEQLDNASSESMGTAEFGFESTESSSLIADLVELQLNSWGRKVAALKENKMADLDHKEGKKKDESKDSSVEFFTELASATANDSAVSKPLFTQEPRDGSEVKVYFRNLTPDFGAVEGSSTSRPKFVNLTPDGYGTNVEGRPDASFEDVSDKKTDDLEGRLQSLGRTGTRKSLKFN